MKFGQIVIGPSGSGKSTYCATLKTSVRRPIAVINLDPANEGLPYTPDVDITELISLAAVMDKLHLGPNASLIYCFEYILQNISWLTDRLKALGERYFVFDIPGQIELFTHNEALPTILQRLEKQGMSLCIVNLVDAHHITDPNKYISATLLSLTSMFNLAFPHVNVLSKIDLISSYDKEPAFNLDFYCQVSDLTYLLQHVESTKTAWDQRHRKLTEALVDVIQDYSLVSFLPLSVNDPATVAEVLMHVDRAVSYVDSKKATEVMQEEKSNLNSIQSLMGLADRFGFLDVQEKYFPSADIEEEDEQER
jgi:GTPase SAR1 family protein